MPGGSSGDGASSSSSGSGREIVPVRSTLGQRARRGLAMLLYPLNATISFINWTDDQILEMYRALVTYTYFGPTRHLAEGFAPAGPNAIGLVMVSSMSSGNILTSAYQHLRTVLESPKLLEKKWGHTGIYVRIGGRIVLVVGFGANGLTVFTQSRVRGGRAHPGRIYDNRFMLDLPTAQTVEFQVDRGTALRAYRELSGLLRAYTERGRIEADYTTNPERRVSQEGPALDYGEQAYKNCVLWAIQHLERIVGRQLLVDRGPRLVEPPLRVVDLGPTVRGTGRPSPLYNASSQGRLVREIHYLSLRRNALVSVAESASSRELRMPSRETDDLVPRVGEYPRSFRMIRLAGNIFVVGASLYFGVRAIRGMGPLAQLSRGRQIAGAALGTYGVMQLARDICNLEFERLAYRIGLLGPPLLAIIAPESRSRILLCTILTWGIHNVAGLLMRVLAWYSRGRR